MVNLWIFTLSHVLHLTLVGCTKSTIVRYISTFVQYISRRLTTGHRPYLSGACWGWWHTVCFCSLQRCACTSRRWQCSGGSATYQRRCCPTGRGGWRGWWCPLRLPVYYQDGVDGWVNHSNVPLGDRVIGGGRDHWRCRQGCVCVLSSGYRG